MPKKSEPPVKEFRSRGIKAAIWSRNKETDNGRKYVEYSVHVTKSYKDDSDDWCDTHYYFPVDLPHLALVTSKAFEWINLKESDE